MKFTKMQGCGNDYIYVNCFEETVEDAPALSIRLSDRHFGIGSDGIILIKPAENADFFMDLYNLDGSRAMMCGNGIRCVGKYVYDHKLTRKTEITVDTLSGVKYLSLNVNPQTDLVESVRVDMGEPCLEPVKIPVNAGLLTASRSIPSACPNGPVRNCPLSIGSETREFTFVSMGNPHAVTFVSDTASLPLEEIGPKYEFHEMFPERANVEFVHVIDRTHIEFRVWERGSGETRACGTGACASVMASIINGLTDNKVYAKMLGGELFIEYENGKIYMSGPAVEVFHGEVEL